MNLNCLHIYKINIFSSDPAKLYLGDLAGRKIKVRAGEPFEIKVPMSGAPQPTCTWSKGGKKIEPSKRTFVSEIKENYILTLIGLKSFTFFESRLICHINTFKTRCVLFSWKPRQTIAKSTLKNQGGKILVLTKSALKTHMAKTPLPLRSDFSSNFFHVLCYDFVLPII